MLFLYEESYKESVHVRYKDDYKESVYITIIVYILLIPNSHDSIFIAFQFIYPEIAFAFLEKGYCFYLEITLKLCFTYSGYMSGKRCTLFCIFSLLKHHLYPLNYTRLCLSAPCF